MSVAKSTAVQILLAWRDKKWVLSRDTVEIGAYAYRTHAMDRARSVAAQASAAGQECYLLIREQNGLWEERPCPQLGRRQGDARG